MGRRNKCKPRMIPEQDKRICVSICLCQLIVVLSCVSLIYLSVAIYYPAHVAFNSGYEAKPVMCQTIKFDNSVNNCSWASCGEWCLTKTSGFCPQMYATSRRNGTEITLLNCTRTAMVSCPQVNPASMKRFNCNNGSECGALTGLFNCSLGHCSNLSDVYQCHYKADGVVIDSDKDNSKLTGFFECKHSKCTKIKRQFNCDRYCTNISTNNVNVFITSDDNLHTAYCDHAIATTEANGNEEGTITKPTVFWRKNMDVLMMSCYTVKRVDNNIFGTDCINGTIFKYEDIPKPSINFTVFWSLLPKWRRFSDNRQKFLPMQSNLTIYNMSQLYINLEGCVNTLRGECKQFIQTHGRDGRNQTAQARYPCFYNKNKSTVVISRFDLNKTWKELIIAIVVPSLLFVFSFTTLCIITQSVKVGDDAKMRCKYCMGSDQDQNELNTTNSKYEMSSPSDTSTMLKKDDTPLVRS